MNLLTRLCCGILFFISSLSSVMADPWRMPPTEIATDNDQIQLNMSEADDNGHVMLLGQIGNSELNAYYFVNGAWTLSTNLLSSEVGSFDIAMDPSGTALAIFIDNTNSTVNSRYFDGSSWSTPTPDPLDSTIPFIFNAAKVAMNGPGEGVAVWYNTSDLVAAFFSGGTWGAPVIMGPGSPDTELIDVVYSANGTAAVVWYDINAATFTIKNFDGATWEPAQALAPSSEYFYSMGIDASGNVYLAGRDIILDDDIIVVHFDAVTSMVYPSQKINTLPAGSDPFIAVAPNGTAVAIWQDQFNDGYSSVFDTVSATWSPEFLFTGANPTFNAKDVSVDPNGNALVVWRSTDESIRASTLPLGSGVWSTPSEIVASSIGTSGNLMSALSANGLQFASWRSQVGELAIHLYANTTAEPLLPAPTGLRVRACGNRNGNTQLDCINYLSWDYSDNPAIASYNILKDEVFDANVPVNDPQVYSDTNAICGQTVVYSVQAVDQDGVPGNLASITFN